MRPTRANDRPTCTIPCMWHWVANRNEIIPWRRRRSGPWCGAQSRSGGGVGTAYTHYDVNRIEKRLFPPETDRHQRNTKSGRCENLFISTMHVRREVNEVCKVPPAAFLWRFAALEKKTAAWFVHIAWALLEISKPPSCHRCAFFAVLGINSAFYRSISQRDVIHFYPTACEKIVKFCMLVINLIWKSSLGL